MHGTGKTTLQVHCICVGCALPDAAIRASGGQVFMRSCFHILMLGRGTKMHCFAGSCDRMFAHTPDAAGAHQGGNVKLHTVRMITSCCHVFIDMARRSSRHMGRTLAQQSSRGHGSGAADVSVHIH